MSGCVDKVLTAELEKLSDEHLLERLLIRERQQKEFRLTPHLLSLIESDIQGIELEAIKRLANKKITKEDLDDRTGSL